MSPICVRRTRWNRLGVVIALFALSSCTRRSELEQLIEDVTVDLESTLPDIRQLLLGSRRLDGNSCVPVVPAWSVRDDQSPPPRIKVKDGGCATFFVLPKAGGPVAHYEILQGSLRPYLQARLQLCEASRAGTEELAAGAAALAAKLAALPAPGASIATRRAALPELRTKPALDQSRPARYLAMLGKALQRPDLDQARILAAEFAASCAHLADLHRWLTLIYGNYIAALDFQRDCKEFFELTSGQYGEESYDPRSTMGRYPGGSLVIYGEHNLYEVERQAEGLFDPRGLDTAGTRHRPAKVPAAYAVPLELRGSFTRLRSALSKANQEAWDRAATEPFHRSCLHNMLYRISTAGAADRAAGALRRLDQRGAAATPTGILDVLAYRGGGFFCGLEWADRFDPRLVAAAATVQGDEQALLKAAAAFTFSRFDANRYRGGVLTLRSALDTGSFDCIRATDMIGATYRNAGGTGLFELRECRFKPPSHTVAGVAAQADGPRLLVRDGLEPGQPEHTWPDSWFRSENEYSVEVYCRGLDTSMFAGGYIIRGPRAGHWTTASLPWLAAFRTPRDERVYQGPFPGAKSR